MQNDNKLCTTDILKSFSISLNAQIQALNSFLLTAREKIDSTEQDLIELTLNSCLNMQTNFKNFLISDSFDTKTISFSYELFDVVSLINEIIKQNEILLKYNYLKIIFEDGESIFINSDKNFLRIIINNFLLNSINFAYTNTEINIKLIYENDKLIFQVKNFSDFIPYENQNLIFLKHKSLSIKNKKTGFGLGLYVAKKILENNNGEVFMHSYENNCNIFGFKIRL